MVAVALDLYSSHDFIRVLCFYATNAGTPAERVARVQSICDSFDILCDTARPPVITGDLNLPKIQWSNLTLSDSNSMEHIRM